MSTNKDKFIPFKLNEQANRKYERADFERDIESGYTKRVPNCIDLWADRNGELFYKAKDKHIRRCREFITNGRRNVIVGVPAGARGVMAKTTRGVAVLVASAFLEHDPKATHVGFINDNPFDCRVENLIATYGRNLYVKRGVLDTTVDFLVAHDDYYEGASLFSEHPKLYEEMTELSMALESKNIENTKEELGDLLYHIMVLCKLAEKEGLFNFEQVEEQIANKMYDRHIAPVLHPESDIYINPLK